MLPILILTLLLTATSAVANPVAGKYQALFTKLFSTTRFTGSISKLTVLRTVTWSPSAPKTAFPAILRSSWDISLSSKPRITAKKSPVYSLSN